MRAILLGVLAVFPAWSFDASTGTVTLLDLHDRFVSATTDRERAQILDQISVSTPSSLADVSSIYDLFMRYRNPYVFSAALKSLSLTRPGGRLGASFVDDMKDADPLAVFFGIKGSLILRYPPALPVIEGIANRRFAYPDPVKAVVPTDKNQWWVQYEALVALAEWQGMKAWPLLMKKTREAPRVARIMARYFWRDSFRLFSGWTTSWFASRRRIAAEGFSGYVPCRELRETWPGLLKLFRSPRIPKSVQASIAVKIGGCATDAELPPFEKEYRLSKDPVQRLLDADILFSARRPAVVPFLEDYAKTNPDPDQRAAAVSELAELVSPKKFMELLQWVSANDHDPDNRQAAARELRALAVAASLQPRQARQDSEDLIPVFVP
jgi:hypothetical protein